MTLDRDPRADRLVEAWLDEGPRTFSPGRLDRTLAQIHGTPQRRQRPLPWSSPRMNLTFVTGLAGAAVLAVLFAAGALLPWLPADILGPAASPGPSATPTVVDTPAPTVAPAPVFLTGTVPLVGTDWLLVGRIDEGRADTDPAYISPIGDQAATLRFADDGAFIGDTGCRAIGGTWDGAPKGARTFPADLTVGPMRTFACVEPMSLQDLGVLQDLEGAGAMQITAGGYDLLASGLTDADLDPALLAHYQANPDLVRLIIRDQSGEGSLVYAPVEPAASVAPSPAGLSAQPTLNVVAGRPSFTDTTWPLAR